MERRFDSKKTSTNSIYESYITSTGKRSGHSDYESKKTFRADFSRYNLKTRFIEAGTNCKWDQENCAGIPMDYDSEEKTLYVDGSDAHTLVLGATGSKKSRLIVMPTVRILASAGESMVICDPKGEIYNRTANYLEECSYNIHTINLRQPERGDAWNLLSIPYFHYYNGDIDKACELINDATINLIPIQARDPYWDYSARDMLFGLILLLFKIGFENNLPEDAINIRMLLNLRWELFDSSDKYEIMRKSIWKYAKEDYLIRSRLIGTVNCPEKTLACIVSTFDQHMSCFSLQPKVVDMLSESTFDMSDMGFSKKAIFLIMPDEKTTYHKIIVVFLKQMYELLIDNAFKKTPNNRFPIRVNFLIDEFSTLPSVSDFPQMITASRSRNIRFLLVAQSKHQLRQRYEYETDTIMSNCTNWVFLTSRELELLKDISQLSGIKNDKGEYLISVSDLQHLNKEKGECLIFSGRKCPYLSNLPDIDYYDGGNYEMPTMKQRDKNNESSILADNYFESLLTQYSSASKKTEEILSSTPPPIFTNDYTLQKELETKFNELFGPIDDDSDNE